MTNPGAATLPYERIVFYTTRCVLLWLWPEPLRRRVMAAAMTAGDDKWAIAIAAIDAAVKVIDETTEPLPLGSASIVRFPGRTRRAARLPCSLKGG